MIQAENKREFTRAERASGLSLWLCYQGGASIWTNLVGGMVLTGLLLELGANDRQIGFLGALAYIGSMTQLIALNISRRVSNQKRWWIISQNIAWVLRATLAIIGLLFTHDRAVRVILFTVGTANFIAALSAPIANSWYVELVSPSLRAAFISKQNLITVTSSVISGLAVGYLLDLFIGCKGFLIAYGLSVPIAFARHTFLKKLPFYDLSLGQRSKDSTSRSGNRDIIKDKDFMAFTVFFNSWVLAANLMAPFTNVYYLKVLYMPYSTLALLTAVANVAALITYPAWGYLINRYGNKPALTIGLIWAVIGNIALILATPQNYTFLFPVVAVGAILSAGYGIAANNMYYSLLPQGERKASYMAFYSTVQGSIGLVAPIIGGYLAAFVANKGFQFLGVSIDYLRILYLGQAILFIFLLPLLKRLKEESAIGLKEFIGEMKTKAPVALLKGMIFSSKSPRASTRAEGVKGLGLAKSPVASERVIKALDDSSIEVRREAINALAELKSRDAVPELITRLKDPGYSHDSDILRALGEIGDVSAVGPIIEYLRAHIDEENSSIEAIMALGILGGDEARDELKSVLANAQEARVIVATIEALGRFREAEELVPKAIQLLSGQVSRHANMRILMSLAKVGNVEGEFYRLNSLPELEVVVRFSKLLSKLRRELGLLDKSYWKSEGFDNEREVMLSFAADLLEAYQIEDEARFEISAKSLIEKLINVIDEGKLVLYSRKSQEMQKQHDINMDILERMCSSGLIEDANFSVYSLAMLLSYNLIAAEEDVIY